MAKPPTNIELFEKTAKKLGLSFLMVPIPGNSQLFKIASKTKFYLGSSSDPGFYPSVARWNATLSRQKHFTQKILKELGYKTIISTVLNPKDFSSHTSMYTHACATHTKFPLLLKPDQGLKGNGIRYIQNKTQLKDALRKLYIKNKVSMLQPILEQDEYRILVINNKVELIHSKEYPVIIGDGRKTIATLLGNIPAEKTDEEFLSITYAKHAWSPETILPAGIPFPYHLTKKPTTTYYRSRKIPKELSQWSVELAKTISAPVLGIDVFIDGPLTNPNKYTIIELNSNPGLSYLYSWCDDAHEPERICEKVLRNFFRL